MGGLLMMRDHRKRASPSFGAAASSGAPTEATQPGADDGAVGRARGGAGTAEGRASSRAWATEAAARAAEGKEGELGWYAQWRLVLSDARLRSAIGLHTAYWWAFSGTQLTV